MLPSMRVMVRLAKKSPKNQSRILEPTSTSRSRLVMPARCRGVIEALHPSTKENVEKIASDYITDSNLRVLLQSGHDGSSQFGQGCTACHKR